MRRVTVEREVRARLYGRQVSPDAVRAIEEHVARVIERVRDDAHRTGNRRVTGTDVRRALRRWDDEG
jgi:histone H3/H4